MARNQSETLPHSGLPEKFHKRVHLFMRAMVIYKQDGGYDQTSTEAYDAFKEYKGSFSLDEERDYNAVALAVREDLERHYHAIVIAEKDAA